jgi:hypothetical protein
LWMASLFSVCLGVDRQQSWASQGPGVRMVMSRTSHAHPHICTEHITNGKHHLYNFSRWCFEPESLRCKGRGTHLSKVIHCYIIMVIPKPFKASIGLLETHSAPSGVGTSDTASLGLMQNAPCVLTWQPEADWNGLMCGVPCIYW